MLKFIAAAAAVLSAVTGLAAIGNALSAPPALTTDAIVFPAAIVPGNRATALLFVGVACPISNRYAPFMAALRKEYRARGVQVVLVYANRGTTETEAARHAKSFGLDTVPRFVDRDQSLTRAVGATVTPQAVVIDAEGMVRYRGRLDDGYAARGLARAVGAGRHELTDALRSLIAGNPVLVPMTQAVGCAIEWNKPAKVTKPVKSGSTTSAIGPTFADVAPILNENCVSCHRVGQIGPMPLDTYEDASRYARNIVQVTQMGQMPPWKPRNAHGTFHGERRLSREQIDTLVQWALMSAPRGNLADVPPTPQFTEGWQLGKPDLVLTMPEAWKLSANAPEMYRCFVLPTGLTKDKEVVAVEYRAGNKAVVHHVLGYIDREGKGRAKDQVDEGQGYTSFCGPGFTPREEIGEWAPGAVPKFLPGGAARLLPAGADFIMQVHYHATGKPEADVTQVGLYFAKKPAPRKFRMLPVAGSTLDIPPGDKVYTVTQTYPVPFNATVLTVTPHMHFLGRTFTLSATLPDGAVKPLIAIDDWDFQWQDTYTFKEPVRLPKGSTVTLRATFDNSPDNPRNPNKPTRRVAWGEAATDEMCIGYLGFTADNEKDPLIRLLDAKGNRKATK